MEYYYLNTTKNRRFPRHSYSQHLTAATVKPPSYATESRLHKRLQTTFLVFWTLAFVLMALSLGACSQDSHTKILLTASSTQETDSSNAPQSKTSAANRFLYMAQEEVEQPTEEQQQTASSVATGSIKLNKDRLLSLSGVIDEGMFGQANKLIELADKSDAPIDIVIASPGGYISHGLMFIQAMKDVKAKGVTIRCVVTSLAASMAYNIFTQCSERYALPYSTLLFHSPRISGQFTIDSQGARQLANDLTQIEKVLLQLVIPVMGIDKASGVWFAESYNAERLFLATELAAESPVKWFTVIARVEGYPGSFPAPYSPSSGAGDLRRARSNPTIREAGR